MRLSETPMMRGKTKENFSDSSEGIILQAFVHKKKNLGNNYEQEFAGEVHVLPNSKAEQCIGNLMYGCEKIDFIEDENDTYIACFRDKRVLISEYLAVEDFRKYKNYVRVKEAFL